jgi:monothiol glutaredoxin
MLRAVFRPSLYRTPLKWQGRTSAARYFSDDSHDDFKPKKKEVQDEDMKEVLELIDKQVKDNPLLLFMKGTPSKPQCGFSLQVVRILNAVGADFSSINVLEYPAIREGVKKYSEWPTIPQLYVNGEFIGGCDIITNMYKEGELESMLKDKKLIKE